MINEMYIDIRSVVFKPINLVLKKRYRRKFLAKACEKVIDEMYADDSCLQYVLIDDSCKEEFIEAIREIYPNVEDVVVEELSAFPFIRVWIIDKDKNKTSFYKFRDSYRRVYRLIAFVIDQASQEDRIYHLGINLIERYIRNTKLQKTILNVLIRLCIKSRMQVLMTTNSKDIEEVIEAISQENQYQDKIKYIK